MNENLCLLLMYLGLTFPTSIFQLRDLLYEICFNNDSELDMETDMENEQLFTNILN